MIGELAIDQIVDGIKEILGEHLTEIQHAYAATGSDPFSLSLKVKIKPVADGDRLDISLSFITGQVKDMVIRIVDEEQIGLFQPGER